MRSRSHPHNGVAATRTRTRAEARTVTLPPPDPWTDRDFAFHVRNSLKRRAYVPSAETKLDAGDRGFSPLARARNAGLRVITLASDAVSPRASASGSRGRGHADASLRDEIAHRIVSEAGDAGLNVTIKVFEGIVTLEGPVPERVTKEMLQAIVEACPGVRGVDNRLRVDWIDETTPSAARAMQAW